MTYAVPELTASLFVAGLLMFWLRELADARPKEADPSWGCLRKLVFSCQGYNKCATIYLTLFYIVMVACFMTLSCTYYIHVKGDPTLDGTFDINGEGGIEAYLWPIIVTLCLLVFYYAQFMIAATMGCARMRDKRIPTARKVTYCSGQVVHFFFIFCVVFGVFSRHFANGGMQLFAFTVCNLYVYMLVIIHWPVKVYFKEYEVAAAGAGNNRDDRGGAVADQEDQEEPDYQAEGFNQLESDPDKAGAHGVVNHDEIELEQQQKNHRN